MRTTITLEPDVEVLLKQAMRKRGLTFKDAVNETVRQRPSPHRETIQPFTQRAFHLGRPPVALTKALALADELDDVDHGRLPAQ